LGVRGPSRIWAREDWRVPVRGEGEGLVTMSRLLLLVVVLAGGGSEEADLSSLSRWAASSE
jgi:hypothetical protein